MNILLIYETYSGSTEEVVDITAQELRNAQKNITVQRLREAKDFSKENAYDLTIFATPSWLQDGKEGQPHMLFGEFMKNNEDITFHGQKFALIGLGDASYTHFCHAIDMLEDFITGRGGEIIAPKLRIDSFYFNKKTETKKLSEWISDLTGRK